MEKEAWDKIVIEHGPRSGAFLQSWEWGEFQKTEGRRVLRIISDNLQSVAQCIEHPVRFGWYGFDLPRGLVRNGDILTAAIKDARRTKAIFLHVEFSTTYATTASLPVEKYPVSNRQPSQTLLLDLSKTENDLLAAMHEKTRYNIRLAERKGVVVSFENDTAVFSNLLKQTTPRDEFSPHQNTHYKLLLQNLVSGACQAKLMVARYENKPLAAMIIICFGNTVTYLHGASSNEQRAVMAPHLLQWRAIQDAKRHGFGWYDFWGIDEQRWPGVTRFKLGFGGERESYPDAFDLPLRPFWYKMYRLGKTMRP